jgi:hypothetical protein
MTTPIAAAPSRNPEFDVDAVYSGSSPKRRPTSTRSRLAVLAIGSAAAALGVHIPP